jgi:hypothetical protein
VADLHPSRDDLRNGMGGYSTAFGEACIPRRRDLASQPCRETGRTRTGVMSSCDRKPQKTSRLPNHVVPHVECVDVLHAQRSLGAVEKGDVGPEGLKS